MNFEKLHPTNEILNLLLSKRSSINLEELRERFSQLVAIPDNLERHDVSEQNQILFTDENLKSIGLENDEQALAIM